MTGGAGYIGSVLVPELLADGRHVTVLDRLFFGRGTLPAASDRLDVVEGDIRNDQLIDEVLRAGRFDAVIHLAAISNDPTSELDPELTKVVNKTAVDSIMHAAKHHGVARFLYASSASVYGIKDTEDVTEDLELEPITLYARYKAEGEDTLWELCDDSFCGVAVRAATVCGYSPRLRLDLTINILTEHAVNRGKICVFGGSQMRPNIHLGDLTRFYRTLLTAPRDAIQGKPFNVSQSNATVLALAEMIRDEVDSAVPIDIVPSQDNRSYHLSAERAAKDLGFAPERPLVEAVRELVAALRDGRVPDATDQVYRNIDLMKGDPEAWKRVPTEVA